MIRPLQERQKGREIRGLFNRGLLVAVLTVTVVGCGDFDDLSARLRDRQQAFAAIEAGLHGTSRNKVIAAMGSPTRTYVMNLAGAEVEVLEFRDRREHYCVFFIGGQALAKSASPIQPNVKE